MAFNEVNNIYFLEGESPTIKFTKHEIKEYILNYVKFRTVESIRHSTA